MADFLYLTAGAGAATAVIAAALIGGALARAGFPLPPRSGRIGRVDGLRGYLALGVLLHHFAVWMLLRRFGRPWEAPRAPLLNEVGNMAVVLFFMSTGLVFYPRVLAGLRRTEWPAVVVTRLFRIVPLTAVSVLAVLLVIAARSDALSRPPSPAVVVQWLSGWGEPPLLGAADSGRVNAFVLWTLWYEWIFYLVVLPACALARDVVRGRLPSWTVPVALLIGARLGVALHVPLPILRYLPMFAGGMIAHEVQARGRLARALRSPLGGAAGLVAFAVVAVRYHEPSATVPLVLIGFCFACVVSGNDLFGLLAKRGALVLSECSFGLYLLHGILLSLLFVDLDAWTRRVPTVALPLLAPLVAGMAVLVAAGCYLMIERPMIRLGARVAARWTGRRVRADAQGMVIAP